jgi:hypothetical protein
MSGGLDQIVLGIAEAVPAFRNLLEILSILIGIVYLIESGTDFLNRSKGRQSGMSSGLNGMEPFIKLICGGLLISFGMTVETLVNTVSGSYVAYDVLNAQEVVGYKQYDQLLTALLHIIQAIGLVGIFSGITIFKAHSSGQQHATMGKAFTHIAGGAFAVNLLGAIEMFEQTTKLSIGSYLG